MESQNSTKIIDLAARKIFVRELISSKRVQSGTPSGDEKQVKKFKEWLVTYDDREVKISVVWLQGLVSQVKEEEDFILLHDGTGTAKITGFSKLPFISTKLQTGQYIMAIAQMVSSGQCPLLRALKLQNLRTNDRPATEKLWTLEVKDQLIHVP